MSKEENIAKHQFALPANHSIVRLQNLSDSEQSKLLPQVLDLVEEQYPEWRQYEKQHTWKQELNSGNANGTKMGISAVLDNQGKVVGASVVEVYSNGTAMIQYSIGHKKADNYLDVVYSATKDMAGGIKEMQSHGTAIDFVGKEHHLDSSRARAGYFAVGQVPLDGSTSLINGPVKYFEAAYGDPKDVNNPTKVKQALGLADPKTGKPQDKDDAVHLWLVQDFIPSHPDKSVAESLKALAVSYPKERSIYRETDISKDPAFQSLNALADSLPPNATYQQAAKASAVGAAEYMELSPHTLSDTQRDSAIRSISAMPENEKTRLISQTALDLEMAKAYIAAIDDPLKRLEAIDKFAALKPAYLAEIQYEKDLRQAGVSADLVAIKTKIFREELMPKNIAEGNLSNIEQALQKGHIMLTVQELNAQNKNIAQSQEPIF